MPFIPHTETEIDSMLGAIGAQSIDDLFDEIPAHLQVDGLENVADGISEMAMLAKLAKRAEQDTAGICFVGAGSYDHHIPAAVWDITARQPVVNS